MNTEAIIDILDDEIQRLTSARNLLNGIEGTDRSTNNHVAATPVQRRPYRRSATKTSAVKGSAPKKRAMTPEGRKRIAEAMKARWAAKRSTVKTIKSVNK